MNIEQIQSIQDKCSKAMGLAFVTVDYKGRPITKYSGFTDHCALGRELQGFSELCEQGDAHGGPWHRQVSLLSYEQIEAFKARGADVSHGSFGENIVVEGFDLKSLPIGTRFACGDVVLELTQVGKQCHAHCAIYHQVGDCIMPREGVFCRVIEGGAIAPGDTIEIAQ